MTESIDIKLDLFHSIYDILYLRTCILVFDSDFTSF
jgi:hypothetical protein